MNTFERLLSTRDYLLADGAMGTLLMAAGLTAGQAPERWNVERPQVIRDAYRAYIEAGSDIFLTNSFGGSRFRLKLHGLDGRVAELNRAAAQLARAEADAAGRPVAVGGSIGPSGELFEPLGTLSFDVACAGFAEQSAALAEGGVDVLWIETMSDLQEVRAAFEGARSVTGLSIVTTMTFDTHGRTMMGVTPVQALEAMRELGAAALGGNCGNGPAEIEGVIRAMHAADPGAALVAKSNAGIPKYVDGEIVFDATPDVMARHALRARALGARIIGGCCGNTPDHVRAMAETLRSGYAEGMDEEPASVQSAAPDQPAQRSRRRLRKS